MVPDTNYQYGGMTMKKAYKIILAALAAVIVFTGCEIALQDEVDRLKKENEDLKGQKTTLEAELASAQGDKTGLEAQIEALDTQIAAKQAQIDAKQSQIDTLTTEKNAAQGKIDGIKTKLVASGKTPAQADAIIADISTLTDEAAALASQLATANEAKSGLQSQIDSLTAQLATANDTTIPGLEAQITAKKAEIDNLNNVTIPGLNNTIAAKDAELTSIANKLTAAGFANVDAVIGELNTARATIIAKNEAISEKENQILELTGQKNDAILAKDAAEADVAAKQATINLMTRQIDLMENGGKKRDAAWFAEFDAIVANAQGIGTQLATVFLGDGLILEAVGGKTEAEIRGIMANIPSNTRVHVAAIDGATVEEIKYGIENGWLPTKTAYTIVHAGRAEVEENQVALNGVNEALATSIGQKIGSIYPVLTTKTTAQGGNATSVIFSGIIPTTSIHEYNTSYINGNDGIKKVVPTNNSSQPRSNANIDNMITDIDDLFNYGIITTTVVSAKRLNQQAIRLANLTGSAGVSGTKFLDKFLS
jgi:peptidoglycan hydrolase CwlO-like protein